MSELPSISFVEGFVKTCTDRGFSPRQTAWLLDQALLQQDFKDPAFRMGMVEYAEKSAGILQNLLQGFNKLSPEARYGLGGALTGGVGGFLTGGKHKLRNALIGAGLGGVAGYGAGKWTGRGKSDLSITDKPELAPGAKLLDAKKNLTPNNLMASPDPSKAVTEGVVGKAPAGVSPVTLAEGNPGAMLTAGKGEIAEQVAKNDAAATGRVQSQINKAPAGPGALLKAVQSDLAAAQKAQALFPGESLPAASQPSLTDVDQSKIVSPEAVAKGERESEQRAIHPSSLSQLAQARIQRALTIANDPNSSIEQIQEANAIIEPYRSTGGAAAGATGGKDIAAAAGKGFVAPFQAVGASPGAAAAAVANKGGEIWGKAKHELYSGAAQPVQGRLNNVEKSLKAALQAQAGGDRGQAGTIKKLQSERAELKSWLETLSRE